MASIVFDVKSNKKTNIKQNIIKKKERIYLNFHHKEPEQPVYYTYMNEEGQEKRFDNSSYNILKVSSDEYVAKKNYVTKLPVTVVKGCSSVNYQREHFVDNENKEYFGDIYYDSENDKYYGIDKRTKCFNKKIKLFEE